MAQRRHRIRTVLYQDQGIAPSELDLLHTPALQRLYELRQLGLTDRVFLDASHSRLHHVIGVLEQADKIVDSVVRNLQEQKNRPQLRYGPPDNEKTVSCSELASLVSINRPVIRLMGLLHDLTHAPFGHTLEDEIALVKRKHDYPDEQANYFYRILCQYFGWLARDNAVIASGSDKHASSEARAHHSSLIGWDQPRQQRIPAPADMETDLRTYLSCPAFFSPPSPEDMLPIASAVLDDNLNTSQFLSFPGPHGLRQFLGELHLAMEALIHLELLHKKHVKPDHVPQSDPYPFQQLIRGALKSIGQPLPGQYEFLPHRDAYMLDIIGNTICADLLDYAKRDSFFTGLKLDYDADRIVENFTLVSAAHGAPEGVVEESGRRFRGRVLRTAISVRTHKLRTDVPGQLLNLLQARYHVYERALFHPTKCVAGAMLGSALQLIGWKDLPIPLRHIGDDVFLYQISEASRLVVEELRKEKRQRKRETRPNPLKRVANDLARFSTCGILAAAHTIVTDRDSKETYATVLNDLDAALSLLQRLGARRYYRPVFRLLASQRLRNANLAHTTSETDQREIEKRKIELVADHFKIATNRKIAERAIEAGAQLPHGSIVIHCPSYVGPRKIAEILLVWDFRDNDGAVAPLNNISLLGNGLFAQHERAVRALEDMYYSMWRLVVSVSPPFVLRHEAIGQVVGEVLRDQLKHVLLMEEPIGNDDTLVWELEHAVARLGEQSDARTSRFEQVSRLCLSLTIPQHMENVDALGVGAALAQFVIARDREVAEYCNNGVLVAAEGADESEYLLSRIQNALTVDAVTLRSFSDER